MNTRIDVALILWNPDVIQLVEVILQQRHLKASGMEPWQETERIENLITNCNPAAVVLDIGPPFQRSIAVGRHLVDRFPDRAFVFTCADARFITAAAPWLCHYPILQKPYEPDHIGEILRFMVNRDKSRVPHDLSMSYAQAGV